MTATAAAVTTTTSATVTTLTTVRAAAGAEPLTLVDVVAAAAELDDTPAGRRAVADLTRTIAELAGLPRLLPDPRDVPLVVRQRELAMAARFAAA